MNYIIDGHNLIAHIPGLSLDMPDDEERLVELLNQFGERERGKLEVYFDGAPSGQAGSRNYGRVQAHFVQKGSSADEAMRKRLTRLGNSTRSWVVVSSDRSVQAAARELHARVMSAEEFTRRIGTALETSLEERSASDQPLSPDEVNEWLAIFKQRKSTK